MITAMDYQHACEILGVDPSLPDLTDGVGIYGFGFAELRRDGKLIELVTFHNLVTQYGDQWYGDRAAGIGAQGAVTGMRLGTGTTPPAKTGAGAAMVNYAGTGITASKALDATYPQSSLVSGSRQIQYVVNWSAGQVTVSGLAEVVLSNLSIATDTGGSAGDTIARALLSPVVNKAAGDTLGVTWNHQILGAT